MTEQYLCACSLLQAERSYALFKQLWRVWTSFLFLDELQHRIACSLLQAERLLCIFKAAMEAVNSYPGWTSTPYWRFSVGALNQYGISLLPECVLRWWNILLTRFNFYRALACMHHPVSLLPQQHIWHVKNTSLYVAVLLQHNLSMMLYPTSILGLTKLKILSGAA